MPVAAVMSGEATIAGRTETIHIEIDFGHFREVSWVNEEVLATVHVISDQLSRGTVPSQGGPLVLRQGHEGQGAGDSLPDLLPGGGHPPLAQQPAPALRGGHPSRCLVREAVYKF